MRFSQTTLAVAACLSAANAFPQLYDLNENDILQERQLETEQFDELYSRNAALDTFDDEFEVLLEREAVVQSLLASPLTQKPKTKPKTKPKKPKLSNEFSGLNPSDLRILARRAQIANMFDEDFEILSEREAVMLSAIPSTNMKPKKKPKKRTRYGPLDPGPAVARRDAASVEDYLDSLIISSRAIPPGAVKQLPRPPRNPATPLRPKRPKIGLRPPGYKGLDLPRGKGAGQSAASQALTERALAESIEDEILATRDAEAEGCADPDAC